MGFTALLLDVSLLAADVHPRVLREQKRGSSVFSSAPCSSESVDGLSPVAYAVMS